MGILRYFIQRSGIFGYFSLIPLIDFIQEIGFLKKDFRAFPSISSGHPGFGLISAQISSAEMLKLVFQMFLRTTSYLRPANVNIS